jgi:hypothetical protein
MPVARMSRNLPEHPRRPLADGAKSDPHLAMVRQCPCVICGKDPCGIAHHLLKPEPGVRGQKRAMDKFAVPICHQDHDAQFPGSLHKHGGEESWFAEHDIDGRGLAKGLWAARGDLDRMREVVRVHRQLARLKRIQREYPGL